MHNIKTLSLFSLGKYFYFHTEYNKIEKKNF